MRFSAADVIVTTSVPHPIAPTTAAPPRAQETLKIRKKFPELWIWSDFTVKK